MSFDFLSVRAKEKEIFSGVLKLLDTVGEAVDSFGSVVVAAAAGRTQEAEAAARRVYEKETEADTIHRELSLKVAEGAFFGGVREDILNLLEEIDNIADSAKDATRFLDADSSLGEQSKEIMGTEAMGLFLKNLKGSVDALTNLLKALNTNKKEALSKVNLVEGFEEEADSHKNTLLRNLFSLPKPMDPVAVIQTRDFLFTADDIADNAEDASDVILVLIAKGYG